MKGSSFSSGNGKDGISQEETEIKKSNEARGNSGNRKRRYKNIVHLWEFLLELLANENLCTIISWSRREHGEFKLEKPEEVARRWGIVRGKKGMTYQKLSRALRFYYGKGIIQKVRGQTFTYKFNKLPYKYEPGLTRALHHRHMIAASMREREETTPDKHAPTQISFLSGQTAFSPNTTPWGYYNSDSIISKHEAFGMCTESASHRTPQMHNDVNLHTVAVPVTVATTGLRPSLHTSTAKAIPVSVIKRVMTVPATDNPHIKTNDSSVCCIKENFH